MSIDGQPDIFVHGSKLTNKLAADERLKAAWELYEVWKSTSLAIEDRSPDGIRRLTTALNEYKDKVEPIFDGRPNSAQEVLQPSIIEEFFEYLFSYIEGDLKLNVIRKPASGYIGLIFNPKSIETLVEAPEYTIRKKDHDFVIGANISVSISSIGSDREMNDTIVVPAIAIECKRYLERNMLDECSGTAERIKKATPYCKYFVVAEFLKMDDASPEISLIDEIYILRKQRNSARLAADFKPNPIDADLIVELYNDCVTHLKRVWWDPESGLKTGKVFNRA